MVKTPSVPISHSGDFIEYTDPEKPQLESKGYFECGLDEPKNKEVHL
jgi:hypothetical protein